MNKPSYARQPPVPQLPEDEDSQSIARRLTRGLTKHADALATGRKPAEAELEQSLVRVCLAVRSSLAACSRCSPCSAAAHRASWVQLSGEYLDPDLAAAIVEAGVVPHLAGLLGAVGVEWLACDGRQGRPTGPSVGPMLWPVWADEGGTLNSASPRAAFYRKCRLLI
jgi:hypothetical protein